MTPGSLSHLEGAFPAPPSTLRITIGNHDVPVISTNEGEVWVQTPWELPAPAFATVRIDSDAGSPFRSEQPMFVSPMQFRPEAMLIQSDWRGFLTGVPKPGEIVHMYATGLGPVEGQPATGVPTPGDRPYPIRGSVVCRFPPFTREAETLFAGLAPGLVGVYQLSFRLPEELAPSPITGGRCRYNYAGMSGSTAWSSLAGLPN